MASKLKGCPFCGSQPEGGKSDVDSSYGVWCLSEACPVMPFVGPYDTEAEAITAWNTRQPDAAVELLREVVKHFSRVSPSSIGNSPGHAHTIPGIWGSDNGDKSGTECEWCKTWARITAYLATLGEQP